MLDADLAGLYGVEVKALNQAVKRNAERFPADFMFQLTREEAAALRSQIVTLDSPHAFAEQGVAMLPSLLKSREAAQVNVEIMRAFVRLRAMAAQNAELARRLDALESKYARSEFNTLGASRSQIVILN